MLPPAADNLRLCYVSGSWAYFTTQHLKDQWGDDWNDAPYEHNAGTPYEYSDHDKKEGKKPWEIVMVAFRCDLSTPDEGQVNSHYSVNMINHNELPWLLDYWGKSGFCIKAGTTLDAFISAIQKRGGSVYLKADAVGNEKGELI